MNQASISSAGGSDPSAEICRRQLARILDSTDFEATARERRFLSHVVEETLAGRGSRIKAYSIAVEVFGRDASFDPQNDPIVRIEAGHLRRSLERYYLKAGKADAVVITIPKGAYVPTFAFRSLVAAEVPSSATQEADAVPVSKGMVRRSLYLLAILAAATAAAVAFLWFRPGVETREAAAPETPRVLVERFEDLSIPAAEPYFASGLTHEVITQLSKFREIVVVEDRGQSMGEARSAPRFALSGSVASSNNEFRLRVRLVNRSDGSVLWAHGYDGATNVTNFVQVQSDIAQNVATSLAQSYGIIFSADAARKIADPPEDWTAYSCTLAYYAYRAAVDRQSLPQVRACLERATRDFPDYATAWALLAQITIDEVRFSFPFDPVAAAPRLDAAIRMAGRAIELDPHNLRGLQARMFGLFFSRQYEQARAAGRQALALNPNDTELMGEFGYRLALSGEWTEGCALVANARRRNPGPLAYFETALALCALRAGDTDEAITWIEKTTAPTNALYHLIAAGIYGEAGRTADAERARLWLEEHEPALARDVAREVGLRIAQPQDVAFFIDCLRKAGFVVPVPETAMESAL